MVITKQFSSRDDVHRLQDLANTMSAEVFIRSLDGGITLNVKSPMGIYALDFTEPVEIVTESAALIQEIVNW